MPADPTRILSLLKEIKQTPIYALEGLDRELLIKVRATLREHKREVDRMLLRLSFLDEQRLNS